LNRQVARDVPSKELERFHGHIKFPLERKERVCVATKDKFARSKLSILREAHEVVLKLMERVGSL
jgi:hypothetical protein